MGSTGVRFVFDYVDPGSYLLHRMVERASPGAQGARGPGNPDVVPHPFELRPPPDPVIHRDDPQWVALCRAMEDEARALDIPLERPAMVPWSRKAHELALQAAEKGCFREVHEALFRAYFVDGTDIGRVDALVELGATHGMDSSETRAALDVDRHREAVELRREEALGWGVRGVPTLLLPDGRRLEGFQRPSVVRTFLEGGPTEPNAGRRR